MLEIFALYTKYIIITKIQITLRLGLFCLHSELTLSFDIFIIFFSWKKFKNNWNLGSLKSRWMEVWRQVEFGKFENNLNLKEYEKNLVSKRYQSDLYF